jgi:hypothetical protein
MPRTAFAQRVLTIGVLIAPVLICLALITMYPSESAKYFNDTAGALHRGIRYIVHSIIIWIDELGTETANDIDPSGVYHQQRDVWTLQTILNCLQIIGIPTAAILFMVRIIQERRKRIADRGKVEIDRYEILQQEYMKFLKLSLEYPELDFGPWPYYTDTQLTTRQAYQRNQLGWILITVFERAYLLRNSMGEQRWNAWLNFIKDYFTSPIFRHIWMWDHDGSSSQNNQIDKEFEIFMTSLFKTTNPLLLKPYSYLSQGERSPKQSPPRSEAK